MQRNATQTKTMHTLAQNIRRYRLQREWSQEKAAHQLGVTLNSWGRWERNLAKPSLDTLERIAELLGVTVADLVTPQEEP